MADDEITVVMFRKWRDTSMIGDGVIALFPCEPADHTGLMCESYEHVGQHGAASPTSVVSRTRPATEAEYAALKRELETPPYGYRLRIVQRTPKNAADIRRQAASDA
jgi:hypothetical protein